MQTQTIKYPSPDGHITFKWNPSDEGETAQARKLFNDMRDKGHSAFHVAGEDRRGRRMDTFDPAASEIIVVPHMRGG